MRAAEKCSVHVGLVQILVTPRSCLKHCYIQLSFKISIDFYLNWFLSPFLFLLPIFVMFIHSRSKFFVLTRQVVHHVCCIFTLYFRGAVRRFTRWLVCWCLVVKVLPDATFLFTANVRFKHRFEWTSRIDSQIQYNILKKMALYTLDASELESAVRLSADVTQIWPLWVQTVALAALGSGCSRWFGEVDAIFSLSRIVYTRCSVTHPPCAPRPGGPPTNA